VIRKKRRKDDACQKACEVFVKSDKSRAKREERKGVEQEVKFLGNNCTAQLMLQTPVEPKICRLRVFNFDRGSSLVACG